MKDFTKPEAIYSHGYKWTFEPETKSYMGQSDQAGLSRFLSKQFGLIPVTRDGNGEVVRVTPRNKALYSELQTTFTQALELAQRVDLRAKEQGHEHFLDHFLVSIGKQVGIHNGVVLVQMNNHFFKKYSDEIGYLGLVCGQDVFTNVEYDSYMVKPDSLLSDYYYEVVEAQKERNKNIVSKAKNKAKELGFDSLEEAVKEVVFHQTGWHPYTNRGWRIHTTNLPEGFGLIMVAMGLEQPEAIKAERGQGFVLFKNSDLGEAFLQSSSFHKINEAKEVAFHKQRLAEVERLGLDIENEDIVIPDMLSGSELLLDAHGNYFKRNEQNRWEVVLDGDEELNPKILVDMVPLGRLSLVGDRPKIVAQGSILERELETYEKLRAKLFNNVSQEHADIVDIDSFNAFIVQAYDWCYGDFSHNYELFIEGELSENGKMRDKIEPLELLTMIYGSDSVNFNYSAGLYRLSLAKDSEIGEMLGEYLAPMIESENNDLFDAANSGAKRAGYQNFEDLIIREILVDQNWQYDDGLEEWILSLSSVSKETVLAIQAYQTKYAADFPAHIRVSDELVVADDTKTSWALAQLQNEGEDIGQALNMVLKEFGIEPKGPNLRVFYGEAEAQQNKPNNQAPGPATLRLIQRRQIESQDAGPGRS